MSLLSLKILAAIYGIFAMYRHMQHCVDKMACLLQPLVDCNGLVSVEMFYVLDCRLREMVLRWLPVSSNSALEGQTPGAGDSPIKTVLRSKGFMWMSHSHTTAFYWSHAGQHFEIRDEGDW